MGTGAHGEANLETVVARLTERLGDLEREHQQKVAELEAEVAALRSAQAVASSPSAGRTKRQGSARTSRRTLLQLGGAAAAATVAAGVLAAERGTAHAYPIRADTPTVQYSASGSGNVAIEGDGTSGAGGVVGTTDLGIGVAGTCVYGIGVSGTSTGVGTGVYGQTNGGSGFAAGLSAAPHVSASAGPAVFGDSSGGIGVQGFSASSVGGHFIGGRASLALGTTASVPGAPTTGQHFHGDVYLDSNTVMWVCVADGTPGTWVRLAGVASGTSGGATTFLSTPIRLLDTRPSASGAATTPGVPVPKYNPGAPNPFHLPVAGVTFGGVTIPSNAQALVGNCTVVNPAGVGDLAVWPDLLALPNTAVMHYLTGQIVSNGITIGLGTNGKLAIAALGNATDVIIDCQGLIA